MKNKKVKQMIESVNMSMGKCPLAPKWLRQSLRTGVVYLNGNELGNKK